MDNFLWGNKNINVSLKSLQYRIQSYQRFGSFFKELNQLYLCAKISNFSSFYPCIPLFRCDYNAKFFHTTNSELQRQQRQPSPFGRQQQQPQRPLKSQQPNTTSVNIWGLFSVFTRT